MQPGQAATTRPEAEPWGTRLALAPFREIFGADLRTLALFRLLLGVYLIADLCLRARDLTAHYSDSGVMPRDFLVGYLSPAAFSLHLANGTAGFQAALFLLAGLFAAMMIVGWRTRLATAASWLLLLSLQNRNPVILSGEDNLALLLLFWALFLPLGARFSVDAALAPPDDKPAPNAFFSVATLALLLQGMSMYFFSALLKSDPKWMPEGTAVYHALQLDYFATSFALWLRQFEPLLQGLTYAVWGLELLGPLLIFSPILQRPLRALLMAAFIAMHLGFLLCLEIGLFPVISIVMVLTFMPGWMWDLLAAKIRPAARRDLAIWYDRDCAFCLKVVRLLRVFLLLPGTPIRPAQADPRMAETLRRHNSWVLTQGGGEYLRWDALRQLVACSPLFWPLARILSLGPLRRLGDRLYLWIAAHRPALGSVTAALLPWRPLKVRPSILGSLLAAACLALVTAQNISTLPAASFQLPSALVQVRQFLGLYQNWTMFAPYPEVTSPWPSIVGKLADGSFVDVYNRQPGLPDFAKPPLVSAVYANYRWRKYLSNLEDQSYDEGPQNLARNYARYLCRSWNAEAAPGKELAVFRIVFAVEWTPPPGGLKELVRRPVWEHNCFG